MPSALLFDIGNVIIRFDFRKTIAAVQDEMDTAPDLALAKVADLTNQLEIGAIEPDEFVERAIQRVGFRGKPDQFRRAFEDIFELNTPMVEFIEEREREGVPLFLLSNTNGIHVPFFTREYPVFAGFRGAIYSHEVGCMKPDPEIYRITIEKLGLDPQSTVYIDDLPANCEAGSESGFLSLQYSHDRHEEFLEAYRSLVG